MGAKAKKLLLLTSCSSLLFPFVGGCAGQQVTAKHVIIRHTVSLEEIRKMCHRHKDAFGCAQWEGTTCNIYVPRREDYIDLKAAVPAARGLADSVIEITILGHETKHCFDGAWH